MHEEGEENWIRGVRGMITEMEWAATHADTQKDTMKYVKRTYSIMMGAKEGLGDYLICRDDLQERIRANEELNALRAELWYLLDGVE